MLASCGNAFSNNKMMQLIVAATFVNRVVTCSLGALDDVVVYQATARYSSAQSWILPKAAEERGTALSNLASTPASSAPTSLPIPAPVLITHGPHPASVYCFQSCLSPCHAWRIASSSVYFTAAVSWLPSWAGWVLRVCLHHITEWVCEYAWMCVCEWGNSVGEEEMEGRGGFWKRQFQQGSY